MQYIWDLLLYVRPKNLKTNYAGNKYDEQWYVFCVFIQKGFRMVGQDQVFHTGNPFESVITLSIQKQHVAFKTIDSKKTTQLKMIPVPTG